MHAKKLLPLGLLGLGFLAMSQGVLAQDATSSDTGEVEVPETVTLDETAEVADADYRQIDEILEGDEEVLSGGGYSYDPAGRRDPFFSLNRRTPLGEEGQRPEGVPGLLIDEIDVKGLFDVEGKKFAQVQTADQEKAYLVQQGDTLFDGEVIRITRTEVVFKQTINDPSIIKPFREVVKKLNPEP
jgi:hypothetical protein